MPSPLALLRHHVSGAIARGEAVAIVEQHPVCSDLHTISLSSYRVPAGHVMWSVGFVGATSYLRRTLAEALEELDFLRTINPAAKLSVSAS